MRSSAHVAPVSPPYREDQDERIDQVLNDRRRECAAENRRMEWTAQLSMD